MNNTNNEMQNAAAITEFEQKAPAARSVGAEMAASREAHEVQVAMVAAKRFPRDEITAYNRILRDCTRQSLAERAMYEYPRGGQMVTGPSIHLARTLARCWGNLDSGFKVLEQNANESTVMAYCWDLETNYRETKVFTVKHIRETKKGAKPLTDSRDIYEMIANQAARRERACILSVIPGDVVDAAVGQCGVTLAGKSKMPLVDMVRILVKEFSERYGVTAEMLEGYIGCKQEAFSQQSVIRLKNVYNLSKRTLFICRISGAGSRRTADRRIPSAVYAASACGFYAPCSCCCGKSPACRDYIVGLDAASQKLMAEPWIYTPVYRQARSSRNTIPLHPRTRTHMQNIGLTYHVGEDYHHIPTGIRHIGEVLTYFGYKAGDRLGHALALHERCGMDSRP